MQTSTVDNKGQYQSKDTSNLFSIEEIVDTHLWMWPPELLQRMNVSRSRLLTDKSMSRDIGNPLYPGEGMYQEHMPHSIHEK